MNTAAAAVRFTRRHAAYSAQSRSRFVALCKTRSDSQASITGVGGGGCCVYSTAPSFSVTFASLRVKEVKTTTNHYHLASPRARAQVLFPPGPRMQELSPPQGLRRSRTHRGCSGHRTSPSSPRVPRAHQSRHRHLRRRFLLSLGLSLHRRWCAPSGPRLSPTRLHPPRNRLFSTLGKEKKEKKAVPTLSPPSVPPSVPPRANPYPPGSGLERRSSHILNGIASTADTMPLPSLIRHISRNHPCHCRRRPLPPTYHFRLRLSLSRCWCSRRRPRLPLAPPRPLVSGPVHRRRVPSQKRDNAVVQ